MWVNGCHVVPFLHSEGEEGFCANVSREIVSTATVDGEVKETKTTVTRGPINSIRLAQKFAHDWVDPENPPPLPEPWVDPEKVKAVEIETKSVEVSNFNLKIDNLPADNKEGDK